MHTDLYQVLGVAPDADAAAIRRAYRQRAFELHPDRHGGNPEAEEKFKALTAAYAVLGDPQRRAAYDRDRAHPGAGAGPDPEELLRSMVRDPAFRAAFEQLAREFSAQGLRFDEAYLRRVFTGSRGPIVFGGVFFAGSLGSLLAALLGGGGRRPAAPAGEAPRPLPRRRPGLFQRLFAPSLPAPDTAGLDVTFTLPVAPQTLAAGGRVTIALPDGAGRRTYQVQVPAGTRPGTRLRLAGQGRTAGRRRGHLLLVVHEAS